MGEKFKIETTEVTVKPLRTISSKWTIEPMREMRSGPETCWERIVSRICYWIGKPCPYTDIMHGLDLEQEMVKALTEEINNNN